jgi:hypothetical protein
MSLLFGNVVVKPRKSLRDSIRHRDVSEGCRHYVIAERILLGRLVLFFNDGYREVQGVDLNDEETHNSELLRFAHASLLINQPVGDKAYLYVDSSQKVVDVWLYGKQIKSTSDLKGFVNVSNE